MSPSRARVSNPPALVTVEEAAAAMRIGRTKAYAMARQWRETGGRSGLPVVDFGHVLRVPLCQLEALIGAPVTKGDLEAANRQVAEAKPAPKTSPVPASPSPTESPRDPRRPRRPRRHPHQDQLDLFGPDLPTR